MNKKQTRQIFRSSVFSRDKFTCQVCGKKRVEVDLDAHHITDRSLMPNGGYVKENGISVCKDPCHMMVEQFHISGHSQWIDGLHPNDLYKKIGSSYELAYKKSENLK